VKGKIQLALEGSTGAADHFVVYTTASYDLLRFQKIDGYPEDAFQQFYSFPRQKPSAKFISGEAAFIQNQNLETF
jgi:hypothetical protein